MRRSTLAAAAVAALLARAAAQAHVTLQPDTAPAGGFTRLDVRVPNERDDAGTTKVDVQLPPGFIAASYEPVPGWKVRLTRSKTAEPIDAGEGLKRATRRCRASPGPATATRAWSRPGSSRTSACR